MMNVSLMTNRIRAEARRCTLPELASQGCPTCGKPAAAPYRRVVAGEIVEGCVDAHHSLGRLTGKSAAWHARTEAIAVRSAMLQSRSGRR
jgi:hypothetical protein